ncbi:MAG: helix-turn-helix transcriptional regulator [Steroidobacteraceae bacterium]
MKQQQTRRTPLGSFLRARRMQSRPEDFGFAAGARRRTPGLRREELAQLAGISPTWVAWIEQGRTRSVSMATLLALARGLHLTRAERAHLFQLAERADPAPLSGAGGEERELRQLLDSLAAPAYVLDRCWDAIAWNAAAEKLFPAWLGRRVRRHAPHPNLLHYVFLDAAAQRQVVDWKSRAQRLVAEFRADTESWRTDPLRQSLVEELCAGSAEFAAAWREERVQEREGGIRVFRSSSGRVREHAQLTLRVARRPDLKLVVLLPGRTAA